MTGLDSSIPPPDEPPVIEDRFDHRPLSVFLLSEIYTVIVCFAISAASQIVAHWVDQITLQFPTVDTAPQRFVGFCLSWISAGGTVMTFVILTLYQVIVLMRRMTRLFR